LLFSIVVRESLGLGGVRPSSSAKQSGCNMAEHLTPGGEAVMGSSRHGWGKMHGRSLSTGQLGRESIPGYTGHVPGRAAENISGATHGEASRLSETACSKRMVARSDADSERGRQWRGHDVLSRTIDCGSMSAGIGTSNHDGLTQMSEFHGPASKSCSMFYNPRGHTKMRSGAAIPGYVGHIPGKYAGNVFTSTYAQSNLAASGVRRREGAEAGTNWILASEFDRAAKDHGAASDLRKTIRTIGFHEGTRAAKTLHYEAFDGKVTAPLEKMRLAKTLRHEEQVDPRVWRLYEPPSTHAKLRVYGH